MIYPNLIEMVKYHPYHISTLADHAGVTTELMEEVVRGNEELSLEEALGIARLYNVQLEVLFLSKLIRMDKENKEHQRMVKELIDWLPVIHEYQLKGSQEAETFMRHGRIYLVNLELFFRDDRATYCQYLGVKQRVEQALSFIRNEQSQPRRLERRKPV